MFYLLEMVKNLTSLFIEKLHIMTCICTGTHLHQSVGGTLKLLISRAYMVCSNKTLLEKELKHLKHVFHKINGYPWWVIDQVSTSFQENINKSKSSEHYPDTSGLSMNILRTGDKSLVQRDFFTNSVGDLLLTGCIIFVIL